MEVLRGIKGVYTPLQAMEIDAKTLEALRERSPECKWRIDWKRVPGNGGKQFLYSPKGILSELKEAE